MADQHDVATPRATGHCLCGSVAFSVYGPLRQVIHCYCGQCRRSHGLMGPYTQCDKSDLQFSADKSLSWFQSSDQAERGFCNACGSSLFWRPTNGDRVSISAGSIDPPTRLDVIGHIYLDDLADFHRLPDDGLPRYATTSDGELDGDQST